jgi:hypothetical protein
LIADGRRFFPLSDKDNKEIRMRRMVSIGLLLCAAAALPAGASTFLKMSQKDLVRDSELVVQGKVLRVSSFWEPTGRAIVTEAMVQVEEAIVGNAPTVVIVRTFGGEVGGYRIEADGFPQFKLNERLVLFLEAENDGVARVAGYQQGQFRVEEKAGVMVAVPAVDEGAHVVNADGRPAPRVKAMNLDELKASIRDEARLAGRFIFEN